MSEYRWYFGDEMCAIKRRAGTNIKEFWPAFMEYGHSKCTYIYDEYHNLIGVIADVQPLFKRLNSTLRKTFKRFKQPYYENWNLEDILEALPRNKFERAIALIERTLVERARKERRSK